MDWTVLAVMGVFFLAAFTQSVAGFGLALVSMAFLPGILGIRAATPLVALGGLIIEVVLLARFWKYLSLAEIWPVVLASFIGMPVGVLLLGRVDERLALGVLGTLLVSYAVYALAGWRLPAMRERIWGYAAGFLGGVFGGAFTTSGPPVIVYANTRQWEPEKFKSNLQGYFIINGFTVLVAHWLSGSITEQVLRYYWWTLPASVMGMLLGSFAERWLSTQTFRRMVLVMLIFMGIRFLI